MPEPDPLTLPRYWGVIPLAVCALLLGARACLHDAPLDRLAVTAREAADPPSTTSYAGSIWIARGGPVVVGFESTRPARLQIGGRTLHGNGVVKERIVVPEGPLALRFAAPSAARLVWSPVGRRGDPEYVPASSLSPEPPERATFDHPGTARLDGAIALGLLLVIGSSLLLLVRRRLAKAPLYVWVGIAAVFAGALLVRLFDLGAEGQTWDEDVYWAAGRNYVTNLVGLDFSDSAWIWNYEHPPITKYLDGIGAQFADDFGPARALSAIWSALGCALLVPIGARLSRLRVGVLAGVIAALLPPLVAHGQIVGHESPALLLWAIPILLSLGVHDDRPERRTLVTRLAWIGAAVGIATASRFVNGFAGPLCAAIVVIQAPAVWRLRTVALGALTMPLAAVLTVYLVWPRLWLHPVANLDAAFAKLSMLHGTEPFLGEMTREPGGHYFAIYLAATAPIGVLIACIAWLVRTSLATRRAFASRMPELVNAHAILLLWFAIPLVGIVLSPVRQDGVRYVMPCILALAVIAAAGIDALATWVRARHAFVALAASFGVYLGITLLRAGPYYLDYFNEGTSAGALAHNKTLEVAWWGEGLDRAVDYVNVNAEPGAVIYRDCVEPAHLAWFREDLWDAMTHDRAAATWAIAYAPRTRDCVLPAEMREVYEVRHDGAVLAVVFHRGR